MRKVLTSFAVFALFALTLALTAVAPRPAAAEIATNEQALSQKVMGRQDAPITILAFESLTCPHCASFHRETLGQLKTEYIDTGKAKLIFIDFPLDPRAMVASMLARCTAKNRFFGMIEILFHNQRKWAGAKDFKAAMQRMSRIGGLTEPEFESCLKNEELYNSIKKNQAEAQKTHAISSTPTFVINGTKLVGAQPFEEFDKIMKPMLR